MKVKFLKALLAGFGFLAGHVCAETSVGISIGVVQPGIYGRIDIGSFPQPSVVLPQPVLISLPPKTVRLQPVYLYVPMEHQKHWSKHCGKYGACGQPVYFVQEGWVRDRYDERQRGHVHAHGHDNDPGQGQGNGRGHGPGGKGKKN